MTARALSAGWIQPRIRAALLTLRHAPDFVPAYRGPATCTILSQGVLLLPAPPLALCGKRNGELP